MALLPTGSPGAEKCSNHLLQEKCCPPQDDLKFEYDCPVELLCSSSGGTLSTLSTPPAFEAGHTVSLEEGLNLLDQVHCDVSLGVGSGDGIHPVPSPPLSDCSSDSGVLGSVQSSEETFLAGLFGSDFSMLQSQSSQLEPYSPTPSPSEHQSTTSFPQLSSRDGHEPRLKSERGTSGASGAMLDKNRKNAEAARQNRIKKKKYVEGLEKECSTLKKDNVILKTKCHEYQNRCQRLQSEVDYLKGVLANESVLSSLLQNIPNVPGVKLTSSFRKRVNPSRRKDSTDSSCGSSSSDESSGVTKKLKLNGSTGICLHVSKNIVSLEFCDNCSKQASTA